MRLTLSNKRITPKNIKIRVIILRRKKFQNRHFSFLIDAYFLHIPTSFYLFCRGSKKMYLVSYLFQAKMFLQSLINENQLFASKGFVMYFSKLNTTLAEYSQYLQNFRNSEFLLNKNLNLVKTRTKQ